MEKAMEGPYLPPEGETDKFSFPLVAPVRAPQTFEVGLIPWRYPQCLRAPT